jgi:hypothetical protein
MVSTCMRLLHEIVCERISGKENDLGMWAELTNSDRSINAAQSPHDYIGHDLIGYDIVVNIDRLFTAPGRKHGESVPFEDGGKRDKNPRSDMKSTIGPSGVISSMLIIDHENRRRQFHSHTKSLSDAQVMVRTYDAFVHG